MESSFFRENATHKNLLQKCTNMEYVPQLTNKVLHYERRKIWIYDFNYMFIINVVIKVSFTVVFYILHDIK